MASSSVLLPLALLALLAFVRIVPAAPIRAEQQDISDFSHSAKLRDLYERQLVHLSKVIGTDSFSDFPEEADIFYYFLDSPDAPGPQPPRLPKRGGF